MSKKRWSIDEKKHHVTAWRASGLTRVQYCELHAIPFKSLSQWPQDIAKAERRANVPAVLPVHIAQPSHADASPPVTNSRVSTSAPDRITRGRLTGDNHRVKMRCPERHEISTDGAS
ncbi:IS66 family insertion sequence element accessory protein TnpB [Salmonella enterica subsp. diarizonae serovar 58:r:z53]|uniref:IS66 family insertion sequence element accessory protein TnpA n=1 Tax=Salmonella enterica TaxID=28901 RepID=UPI001CF3E60B